MFKHYRLGRAISLVAVFAINILPSIAIAKGIPTRWAAKRYKVPAVGIPLRREAAATRGNCPAETLIALTPPQSIATTTTAYPTLFFRVPAISGNSLPFKFELKDGNKTIYQTTLQVTGNRRIVAISLPSTAKLAPLTIDRDYRWLSKLQCSNDEESANLVTTGIIRRIAPDAALSAKIKAVSQADSASAQPPQLPEIYAEAEIWQDALMELVSLRRLQPQNPQVLAQWRRLLKSADLDAVANDPLDFLQK